MADAAPSSQLRETKMPKLDASGTHPVPPAKDYSMSFMRINPLLTGGPHETVQEYRERFANLKGYDESKPNGGL